MRTGEGFPARRCMCGSKAKVPNAGFHAPDGPPAVVRGWCPTAWRPMMAGDGLLVRVRPPLGRLTVAQALALALAAARHGNDLIDLTNRAALQIRGVTEQSHAALIGELIAHGLTDADPIREGRRAILLTPDWTQGDDTHGIALSLLARLDELPDLPAKIGIAIDTGPAPALSETPADFRFERSEDGTLLLRADGRAQGTPITTDSAIDALIALTRWFVASGGMEAGRMRRHHAPIPDARRIAPATPRAPLQTLSTAPGPFHGVPFGQLDSATLIALADRATALRLTPWRGLVVEGGTATPRHGLTDPLLQIDACPGAPACPQATVETRALAARLAPHAKGRLHISGCAKGCARPRPADLTLTGRDGRFDLAQQARAGSPPIRTGLTPDDITALIGLP